MQLKQVVSILGTGASLFLSACNPATPVTGSPNPEDLGPKYEYQAAISTFADGYLSGAVQIADVNRSQASFIMSNEVISQSMSDFTVSAHKDNFYHLGRYNVNKAYKYSNDPLTQHWVDSADNQGFDLLGLDTDANAYDMVFVSETKAYVIRYGSDKVWIVNPAATDEANFKIGELDLRAYTEAGGDGVPEMAGAKIIGDKLFIVFQRLKNWCPEEPDAYVAVFNTLNDTEVDVDSANDPLGLKGIRLSIRNPQTIDYQEDIGLVIAGVGAGTIFACTPANRYSGGIEVINPATYENELLLDDGDETLHAYDFISAATVIDKNNGYFVSYAGWQDTRLYHFNPSTKVVSGVVPGFGDTASVDIRVLKKAPDNSTWIGLASDDGDNLTVPAFIVLDKNQNELASLNLIKNPQQVAFFNTTGPAIEVLSAPFAPAHNQSGTTAIAFDDTAIISWATGYENYLPGTEIFETWKTPTQALGLPGDSDGSNKGFTYDIVSLGRSGEITLTFDSPITNGAGADFAVFENSFNTTFLELAWVEVSSDGLNFYRFPNYSYTASPVGGFGAIDPTNVHGFAGKYQGGFGTPFDLELLKNQPGLDVNRVTHIKIIDVVGNGTAVDSLGQVIYEPYPTVQSAGFDLDAVGVINQAN